MGTASAETGTLKVTREEVLRLERIDRAVEEILRNLPAAVNREEVGHLISLVLGHMGVTQQLENPSDYGRSTNAAGTLRRRATILVDIAGMLKNCAAQKLTDHPSVPRGIVDALRARLTQMRVLHSRGGKVTVRHDDTQEALATQAVPEEILRHIQPQE